MTNVLQQRQGYKILLGELSYKGLPISIQLRGKDKILKQDLTDNCSTTPPSMNNEHMQGFNTSIMGKHLPPHSQCWTLIQHQPMNLTTCFSSTALRSKHRDSQRPQVKTGEGQNVLFAQNICSLIFVKVEPIIESYTVRWFATAFGQNTPCKQLPLITSKFS